MATPLSTRTLRSGKGREVQEAVQEAVRAPKRPRSETNENVAKKVAKKVTFADAFALMTPAEVEARAAELKLVMIAEYKEERAAAAKKAEEASERRYEEAKLEKKLAAASAKAELAEAEKNAAIEAVSADIRERRAACDSAKASNWTPPQRRVTKAWQASQEEEQQGESMGRYSAGEAPGRYAGISEVPETEYNEATAGLKDPRVVRVRREVPRGLCPSTHEDAVESIYLSTDLPLSPAVETLLADSLRGVVGGHDVFKFEDWMEAMGMERFEFDVRLASGAGDPREPSVEYVTERLWVWERSRAAVMLRALIEAAKAKAAALASPSCSPVGGCIICNQPRYSTRTYVASPHYSPTGPGSPRYSATSPNYDPKAPCYSATGQNYCFSPKEPRNGWS